MVVALGLDLVAWSGTRHIPVLAGNPGSASALALCWVHAFVLPPLLGRPWGSVLRLLLCAGVGVLAAPLALMGGLVVGLNVGSMAFLIGFGVSSLAGESAAYDPPGPLLRAVEDVLGGVMLWSGPAAGAAVSAIIAVGLSALLPGVQRPRISWWVVAVGAWASVVFVPDWLIAALQPPWREPVLLIAAGLASVVLVNMRAITRNQAD